jgi:hypothetical protein
VSDETSYQCLCCGKKFPISSIGGGHYPIRPVRAWAGALICEPCRSSDWDGIVPERKTLLAAHFAKHGISPVENEKGWWSIPQ